MHLDSESMPLAEWIVRYPGVTVLRRKHYTPDGVMGKAFDDHSHKPRSPLPKSENGKDVPSVAVGDDASWLIIEPGQSFIVLDGEWLFCA